MKQFLLGIVTGAVLMALLQRLRAMPISQEQIDLYYKQRASGYAESDDAFSLGGYKPRLELRKQAIALLDLTPGAKVLDIACGTGANFPYLLQKIGPTGEIIAVDHNPVMLLEAQRQIDEHGWENIFLIQQDAAKVETGEHYDAVICVLGMSVIPDYESAMRHAFAHVRQGGQLVIADLCYNPHWYMQPFNWLADLFVIQEAARRPWELLQAWGQDFERHELLLGYMYVATGRKGRNIP
jgi:demethylmenaquinone methyltransferase/2-methoxy-6-polyprenyl-1,4-benzoquinol methylase